MSVQVLAALETLPRWERGGLGSSGTNAEVVSRHSEAAVVVAKLAGAMQNLQPGVDSYMQTFEPLSFLWLKDLASEYAAFLATSPQLEVRSQI